jgi:[acyl-carrier-protein] S-malonyltransferase
MSRALLFAGQGSQYVGMAKELMEKYHVAAELGSRANTLLGVNLTDMMINGPADVLTETRNTQPALFLHEAMILAVTNIHTTAQYVAGHSLGEFSALHAAGVLSFDDAVRLVRMRGELMYEAGLKLPGTMAAVVGLDDDVVESLCAELNTGDDHVIVAANYNAPGQVVISGSRDHVRASLEAFKQRGAKIVKELNVSGAFHSPLLGQASLPFADALDATTFRDAAMPVIVNTLGSPLTKGDDLREAAKAQLTSAVRWTQSMLAMKGEGVTEYVEIGPGKVLQGLAKRSVDGDLRGLDTAQDCADYLTLQQG